MDVLGSFSNTLTSIMDMVSAATTPYVYVCMYVCMCVCVFGFFFLDIYPGVELLGRMVVQFLVFK